MLSGKRSPGMTLEIFLECDSLFPRTKSYYRLYAPRSIFSCMRNLPGVVCFDTGIQVLRRACIMMVITCFTDQDIDVVKSIVHLLFFVVVRIRASFATTH